LKDLPKLSRRYATKLIVGCVRHLLTSNSI